VTETLPDTQSSRGGRAGEPTVGTGAADFRRIYQAEAAFVWNRLRRLGVAERDLADKVHDVFLIAYQRLASYDASRPIRPWLAGITVRVALDHHQLARHRREVPRGAVEALDRRPSPESAAVESEARRLVHAALDELPEDQRVVFVLKELEGFSMPEIATMLEAPLNTLYSRLRLGRERFCSAVQRRIGRAPEKVHHAR
jgi:RNA polymerase sigma-70 factor, ECF subfamily